MSDKWSGFADLLANLIEKYAEVLEIDDLPEPPICLAEVEKELADNSKLFAEAVERKETA